MLNTILLPVLLLLQDSAPAGNAPAGNAPGAAGGGGIIQTIVDSGFVPLILCGVAVWFIILRPDSKQRKKRLEMIANIKKGDRVQTNGGLLGTVVQVQENIVTLQVDEGVRLRFVQSAIGNVLDDDGKSLADKK